MTPDELLKKGGDMLEQTKKEGLKPFDDTPVITPESLVPATPVSVPPTPISTAGVGMSEYAKALAEQNKLKVEAENKLIQEQKEATESKGTLEKLRDSIMGVEESRVKEEEDAGLAAKRQLVTDYTNKIEASQRAQLNEIRELEKNAAGGFGGNLEQERRRINREYQFEQADLALLQSAANRDFETASNIIDRKIQLKLEPLKTKLEFEKLFYQDNREDLTKAEQRAFDLKIKGSEEALSRAEKVETAIADITLKALENGIQIPERVMSQLNKATSEKEAVEILARNGISLAKPKTTSPTSPLGILDVQRYQELYPDAGVEAGDTEAVANAKVAASNSPEAKLRSLIVAAQESNNDYETVIEEINNDGSIKDKASAIAIANEVYGMGAEETAEQSKIERDIAPMVEGGILTKGDMREALRNRGYTEAEIANSSVGSVIDKIGQFLFGE